MLTKIVNGKEVVLSDKEEEEIKTEWTQSNQKKQAEAWLEGRKEEYPSPLDMIVALWEKLIENRPEAADDLQTQRQAVKDKYPKPVSE